MEHSPDERHCATAYQRRQSDTAPCGRSFVLWLHSLVMVSKAGVSSDLVKDKNHSVFKANNKKKSFRDFNF